MNAVIYARFSSSSQTEQSIEGQLKYCYEYAKSNDLTVIREYIDRAKSGTSAEKRDSFQKMIADSSKKQFDFVLVYQLDRFARNRYDSATNKAKLKKNGVRVISVRENISDDASGVLMEAVLEGMAEYYSVELSQKIKRGMDLNAQKRLVFGSIPWGYKSIDKQFVIDDEIAPYVRKVFEMYNSGTKMVEICDYLNGLGLKTRAGNSFTVTFINKLLKNRRYTGTYTYGELEVEDAIPAIITKELFEDIAKVLEKNKKSPASSKALNELYILSGKLFCGHCKSAMTGTSGTSRSGKVHQYYGCVNGFKGSKACNKKLVKKQNLEDIVAVECHNMLTDENIALIADKVIAVCEQEKDTSNYTRLVTAIKENDKQKQNLVNSLKVGADNENFQKLIFEQFEALDRQQDELKKELNLEDSLQNSLSREMIMFFLNNLKNGDINDYKYRKLLVDVFVNKIYLYDDKITIFFTTQSEMVDIDISLVEEIDGSNLNGFAPPKNSLNICECPQTKTPLL